MEINQNLYNEIVECTKCACFNFRIATRSLTQHYDNVMKPTGILSTQFTLLVAVTLLGPITITKLAEKAVMDRTTLSRNIRPLKKMGLLRIQPGEDKREKVIEITNKGIKKLEESLPLWKKAQRRALSGVGEENWDSVRNELFKFVESVS